MNVHQSLIGKRRQLPKNIMAKSMKIFLASLIAVSSFGCLPALADLNEADVPPSNSPKVLPDKFKAWCVEKYNDCNVRISDGRIAINDSNGVELGELLSWRRVDKFRDSSGFIGAHHLYNYEVHYKDSKGMYRTAKFVFQDSNTSDLFYQKLKEAMGSKEVRCDYNFASRTVEC